MKLWEWVETRIILRAVLVCWLGIIVVLLFLPVAVWMDVGRSISDALGLG